MDPSPLSSDPRRAHLAGAAVYTAVVGLIAVGVGALLATFGPRPATFAAIYGFMLSPALVAMAIRLVRREGFVDAGLRFGGAPAQSAGRRARLRAGGRWYLLAWGIGVGGTALVYLVLWAVGEARVDLNWNRIIALAPPDSPAQEPPAWLGERHFMILAALANITVMLLPGMILGLGEELGWRGYLLPRLLGTRMGVWPAVVATGLIWALWHLPLNLVMPARVPWWVGVPAGLIAAVCVSAIFAWLRARSGSIFVAALAHIAFNNANAAAVLIFDVRPVPFLVGLVSLTVVLVGGLVVTGEMQRVGEIVNGRPAAKSP